MYNDNLVPTWVIEGGCCGGSDRFRLGRLSGMNI